MTALHFAAEKGKKDIIELLIDPIFQTDIMIRDKVMNASSLSQTWNMLLIYRSLEKKGPWAVHLTLGSNWGVGQHSSYQ